MVDLDVGLRRVAVAARPSGEGVAVARRRRQRERRAFDVVGTGIARAARQRAAGGVVGDGVVDGRPVRGVGPGSRGALGDGDGGLRRRAVAARPAGERVAGARRIVQREGGRVDVVGGGVVRRRAAVGVVGDGVRDDRRRDVHVDVGGAAAAAGVQVVGGRRVVLAYAAGAGVVEFDGGYGVPGLDGILRVVEVDRVAVGVAVQVAMPVREVLAANEGGKVVGPVAVRQVLGRVRARGRLEVEARHEVVAGVGAGNVDAPVEQVDVVGAGPAALVEVVVDDRPALARVRVLQRGDRILVRVADDHYVLDERRGPCGRGGEKKRRERGEHGARGPGEGESVHGVPPISDYAPYSTATASRAQARFERGDSPK